MLSGSSARNEKSGSCEGSEQSDRRKENDCREKDRDLLEHREGQPVNDFLRGQMEAALSER